MTYFLLPPSGDVAATPTIGDKSVFASMSSEQTPGRVAKKYVILNDSEESHRRTDGHILLT